MKCILGKKLGMTTIYREGEALNVTILECHPNKVKMLRTEEKDGYRAIQLELEKTRKKKLKKEFRLEDAETKMPKIESEVNVSIFSEGDVVKVSGAAKAKGFQGVVKRHGFSGSPASHGHKHDLRAPGSIGAGFPEHVVKGKRMAGRTGGKRATSKNLKIVMIDPEKNYIAVLGPVPGVSGRIVEIASVK
jgi:large subunit ribosomal protein L3